MTRTIMFVLLFTFVGCNETPIKLSKTEITHDAELRLTTKGWYLNETYHQKLSQVKGSSILSSETKLLFTPCYNVSYENVVNTLDLVKELKIDNFSMITEQSSSICD
ncbi:hypothetical protein [uncultured Cocleimonas sp.]|uniref:hypothetical protein n=1 Tax=uncultured Cocleimonas sp. TaxID=1051587 RepID=UPI002613C483|nr:hypothetical protein [uncultured Cocleimonas sp.]